MEWITAHWLEVVGILWGFDQILKIVAKLNPKQDWVDNLSDMLGNLLVNFFPKGK